jgi:transcription antitermination factor NusG
MIRWYVIHSKHQQELLLSDQLCLRGIEAYCPFVRLKPVNPRARKIRPYFPGYVFAHADLDRVGISTLRWMPGAISIVNFGGEPAYIHDHILNAIRQRVEQINSEVKFHVDRLAAGDDVSIKDGPFKGYRAIFDMRLPGAERVRVLLQFIQDRQVLVELPVEQIS